MIFVSYFIGLLPSSGIGNSTLEMDGIFSVDDIRQAENLISEKCGEDGSKEKIIILTWRKFDAPL